MLKNMLVIGPLDLGGQKLKRRRTRMSKIANNFEKRIEGKPGLAPYYLTQDVAQLLDHTRQLETMLRKHGIDDTQWCRECEEFDEHSPNCALAKLLE